jgi:acetoacetyl-CoA reductase/3-oxoacyl-[acyl-carrier protein] reductase
MSQAATRARSSAAAGRIVNISSIAGQIGNVGQANYAASKSGLFGLTKTLAREAALALARGGKLDHDSVGLTINTVAPGLVATEMVEHIPQAVMDRFIEQIPVRRLGRPDEIARVVGFLCADASSYITGQVWSVNGGLDM